MTPTPSAPAEQGDSAPHVAEPEPQVISELRVYATDPDACMSRSPYVPLSQNTLRKAIHAYDTLLARATAAEAASRAKDAEIGRLTALIEPYKRDCTRLVAVEAAHIEELKQAESSARDLREALTHMVDVYSLACPITFEMCKECQSAKAALSAALKK